MTRQTYRQAIDAILSPMGFAEREDPGIGKREKTWSRTRNGFREDVMLQYSQYSGMTANVLVTDLENERLLREITGLFQEPKQWTRISTAAGLNSDLWFKDDPAGPRTLAKLIQDHAEPFFDRVRSLEDQASKWYARATSRRDPGPNAIMLAITLYRMGEFSEAIAVASGPPRRSSAKNWIDATARTRRWIEARVAEAQDKTAPP